MPADDSTARRGLLPVVGFLAAILVPARLRADGLPTGPAIPDVASLALRGALRLTGARPGPGSAVGLSRPTCWTFTGEPYEILPGATWLD
ncbi:hypothetical protein ACF08M_28145 [Streptomyces sp. NPDC015032]|uniref:hypothetical protein n=1 Tax=Streptomyces sp. NPDC015032 TaxID=3364937 RepID=UPI0036F865E5